MRLSTALAFFAFFALASQTLASKPYTEFANINSRVPGDKLIFESSLGQQNLDFYAKVTLEISYPQNNSRGPYNITHVHIDAKENTGLMQLSTYGGPGSDFMRLRLIANSVMVGNYKVYVYGLKK